MDFVDTNYIIPILEEAVDTNEIRDVEEDTVKLLENRLIHQQVSKVKTMDEVMLQVLSGLIVIFVEGETEAFGN